MFIKSLKAKNYRSFSSEFEYFPTNGINTIVGENNVGKSNTIKAIQDIIVVLKDYTLDNPQSFQNNDQSIFLECELDLDDYDVNYLMNHMNLPSTYLEDFKNIFGTHVKISYEYNKRIQRSPRIEMNDILFNDNQCLLKKH